MTLLRTKSIAILNTTAPFAQPNAKDALDVALIMGSYEQETHLFFQGDGVWQLIKEQTPTDISVKDFLKTFAAFEFYDLNNVYICQKSLEERGLTAIFHIDNVHVMSSTQFADKLSQNDIIFRF